MTNNSLKEYYIKIQTLYNNAINMLTAINQSLTTSASEVSINVYDEDNISNTIKIPSFLHLDSKLEQLQTVVNNLFDMPNSGEAWFQNTGNMYKLELLHSNTAPIIPDLETTNITAQFNNNTFIKDLVNPRTFLKININNLPNNIEQMYMRKIVLLNNSIYNELLQMEISSYSDYKAALYNYRQGIDYEEYDDTINLPIKVDKYDSAFKILNIVKDGYYADGNNTRLSYIIQVDTLEYMNSEDTSIIYKLNVGDYICNNSKFVIYKIKDINYATSEIEIEEHIGHITLQTITDNSDMILQKYNYDFSKYNYIEVPLEENPYIIVFIGAIYNGIRSNLSDGILFDLNSILMTNSDGSYIKDINGNNINYMQYYNEYCNNIGDLILGLTQTAYPQISNYNAYQLNILQDSEDLVPFIDETFHKENTLSVLPINSHLLENDTVEKIKNYHSQKTALQSELSTLTENINTVNNTLLTTDWSQETDITQDSLHAKLQQHYSERLTLEKQLNAVINELNIMVNENGASSNTKYRIRGTANTVYLENYIKSLTNNKVDIIGMEVEYKYKSISKDTTTLLNIDNNVFTDWNRQNNIDRQRKLVFNTENGANGYTVSFVNYDSLTNIIKWNQFDIPITVNEDVIIRVRYKYNIGQPFINIYSPWSSELTVKFPIEYSDNVELSTIIENNNRDAINAEFTNKLINDGYEEHITNKLTVSNQTFYHTADSIYSGFNTSENNLLSLKEKLSLMCLDIDTYKDLLPTENQKKYSIFLQYDDKNIELTSKTTNNITIFNSEHVSDFFVKKNMNIVIKNTGNVAINLYSIFPGNVDVPLLLSNIDYYNNNKKNYQRHPIFVNGEITPQKLGQWIYFRENNVYTGQSLLYNSINQQQEDKLRNNEYKQIIGDYKNYLNVNNIQLGFANKFDNTEDYNNYENRLGFISKATSSFIKSSNPLYSTNNITSDNYSIDKYIYNYNSADYYTNSAIYKYEDIYVTRNNIKIYLDDKTSLEEYLTTYTDCNFNKIEDFIGGFFYVDLDNNTYLNTDGTERGNKIIEVGEYLSIPVVFEYVLSQGGEITKSLMFDLKPSLVNNPINYIVSITAKYQASSNDKITNNSGEETSTKYGTQGDDAEY